MELNIQRFNSILQHVHTHENSTYKLFDNNNHYVEALYDTDYESDNGLDEDEEGFEEYQCIVFKRTDNGNLFEINYHNIPVSILCDEQAVY